MWFILGSIAASLSVVWYVMLVSVLGLIVGSACWLMSLWTARQAFRWLQRRVTFPIPQ